MRSKQHILFLFILIFSACNKMHTYDWEIPYGSWKIHSYEDDMVIYQLTGTYEIDDGGFSIKPDNEFIYRSFGWCGTPPLIYYDIEGLWKELDENVLKVSFFEYDYEIEWVMEIVNRQQYFLTVIHHYDWE